MTRPYAATKTSDLENIKNTLSAVIAAESAKGINVDSLISSLQAVCEEIAIRNN